FGIDGGRYTTTVRSGGPNRRLEPPGEWGRDDVMVFSTGIEYFAATRARIELALSDHLANGGRFPRDEAQFFTLVEKAGIARAELVDGWGNPLRVSFRFEPRKRDRIESELYARHGEKP